MPYDWINMIGPNILVDLFLATFGELDFTYTFGYTKGSLESGCVTTFLPELALINFHLPRYFPIPSPLPPAIFNDGQNTTIRIYFASEQHDGIWVGFL
jgi:hypothetical protein